MRQENWNTTLQPELNNLKQSFGDKKKYCEWENNSEQKLTKNKEIPTSSLGLGEKKINIFIPTNREISFIFLEFGICVLGLPI